MKPTTPTLYWGLILQTGCVIIIAIDIAIDIGVHAIANHFQNLARTFVTPLYESTRNRGFGCQSGHFGVRNGCFANDLKWLISVAETSISDTETVVSDTKASVLAPKQPFRALLSAPKRLFQAANGYENKRVRK